MRSVSSTCFPLASSLSFTESYCWFLMRATQSLAYLRIVRAARTEFAITVATKTSTISTETVREALTSFLLSCPNQPSKCPKTDAKRHSVYRLHSFVKICALEKESVSYVFVDQVVNVSLMKAPMIQTARASYVCSGMQVIVKAKTTFRSN